MGLSQNNKKTWLGWPLWNICVTNDHGYVPLVENTSRSFPHSWFITGFVATLTRRVSLVEQELLTTSEHMISPPVFSWFRVTWSLVLYLCFVHRCSSFCTFSFDHCVVCSFSIYDSDYPFGIFKLFLLLIIVLSVLFRYMNTDYLPLVSSNSSYFWPLCCLFFLDIWILITSLWYLQIFLTFDHCIVCSF